MEGLYKSAKDITKTRGEVDDTLADRLSSKYTAGILMFFAAFAMTRATFGSPLTCWMPVHFTGSHTKYTNRSLLCILNISSTYYSIRYFCSTPCGISLVTASWKFVQSIYTFSWLSKVIILQTSYHSKHEIFNSKLRSASLPCTRTTANIYHDCCIICNDVYSYCWIFNTYYVPWEQVDMPSEHSDDRQYITYYQWVPFIFAVQAIFFYLPCAFWHAFNSKGG